MALQQSPSIVTNGLIFYYDMANTQKSYKGKPITNQFAVPTPDSSLNVTFSVQGTGTFSRVISGNYGGYDIKSTDVVYRYNLGTTGCHYHGNSAAIAAGQYVTFTVDYYISPDAASYPTITQLLVLENYGGSALGTSVGVPNNKKGEWQTLTLTAGPTSGSGTQAMFLYPGGCSSSYLASSGYILMKNPQCIFSSTSGDTTAFVSGTRSTTQVVQDIINSGTLTATNLTYNSNNTFDFGASSVITAPMANLRPVSQITQECWFSTTSNTTQVFIGSQYGTGSDNSYALWLNGANTWAAGVNVGSGINYQNYSATVSLNTYYHYVHTYDGSTQRVYINGTQVNSWATTGSIVYNTSNTLLAIGNDWNGSGYDTGASIGVIGKMPIVKIYNRALSAVEIKQNYNGLKNRFVGSNSDNPALSASHILAAAGYAGNPPNGVYWLQPAGATTPFQAYIDFTTVNGPWVMVGTAANVTAGGELWPYPSTWTERTTNYGSTYTDPSASATSFNAGAFIYCKGSRIMVKEGGGTNGGSVGYTQCTGFNNESWRDVYKPINMSAWPSTPSYLRILPIATKTVPSTSLIYGVSWYSAGVYDSFIAYCFDQSNDTMAMLTTFPYDPSASAQGECDVGIGANESGAAVGSPSSPVLGSGVSYDAGSNSTTATGWSAGTPFSMWIKN